MPRLAPYVPSSQNAGSPDRDSGGLSTFLKLVDFLNRPNYGIMGAARSVQKGEDPLRGLFAGLTGREKETASDVFEAAGWKPTTTAGKVARGAAGLFTDVALDPTSYIGLGVLGKIGKSSPLTRRALTANIPFLKKSVNLLPEAVNTAIPRAVGSAVEKARVAPGVRQGVDVWGKLFHTRPAGMSKAAYQLAEEGKFRAFGIERENVKDVKNFIRELTPDVRALSKADRKVLSRKAVAAMEKGETAFPSWNLKPIIQKLMSRQSQPGNLKPIIQKLMSRQSQPGNLKPIIQKMMSRQAGLEQRFLKAGGTPIDEFGVKYFAHLKPGARRFSGRTHADFHRQVMEFTNVKTGRKVVGKAGDLGFTPSNKFKSATGETYVRSQATVVSGKFETDPIKVMTAMGLSVGRKEAGMEFMKYARKLGVSAPTATHHVKIMDPMLKDLWFAPAEKKYLNRTHEALTGDEGTNAVIKTLDKFTNWWKGIATYINPPFHSRNIGANVWNNYLSGMGPETAGMQIRAMKDMASGKIEKEFIENGLMNSGWIGSDIQKTVDSLVKGRWREKLSFPMEKMAAFGEWTENSAKLAHYRHKIGLGYTPAEAASSTRKFLFDYMDISPFEKNVLKRIFPFYFWTSRNLPLQVQALFERPGRISAIGKIKQNVEKQGEPVDLGELPEVMKERSVVQIPGARPGRADLAYMEGFIPSTDLGRLTKPARSALELLTPMIKTPMELITNKNLYFDAPLEKYPGEPTTLFHGLLGDKAPVVSKRHTRHPLSVIRPLNDIERLFGEREANRPLVNRILGYLSGAKVREFDPAEAAYYSNVGFKRELASIKGSMRKAKTDKQMREIQEKLKDLLNKRG
jgi:hypothetical protein